MIFFIFYYFIIFIFVIELHLILLNFILDLFLEQGGLFVLLKFCYLLNFLDNYVFLIFYYHFCIICKVLIFWKIMFSLYFITFFVLFAKFIFFGQLCFPKYYITIFVLFTKFVGHICNFSGQINLASKIIFPNDIFTPKIYNKIL